MTMHTANLAPFLLILVIAGFGIYRRARSHIGRQRVRPTRFKIRMAILCAISIALMVFSHAPLLPAAAGAVIGAIIAVFALRLTKMERTPEGTFYTGNIYIGLALLLLFVGRLGYRLVTTAGAIGTAHAGAPPNQAMMASSMANPTTLGVFLLLIGYYVVYYVGILRMAAKLRAEQSPPSEPA
jgi:hypothetical protein